MWASLREYHRPATIGTALKLLARSAPRTVPLAGGAWLVAQRNPAIEAVVDLSALDLDFVKTRGRRVHLGATTTLQTLATHPTVHTLASGLLAKAAQRSAPYALRNLATLGGTLVVGEPTAETALALLVLEARIVIRNSQRQTVEAEVFLENPPEYLSPSGLIVEIAIPVLEAETGTALAEVSPTPHDRPIVNAAALVSLQGGTIRTARLALGGVAPRPIRLLSVDATLRGKPLDDERLTEVVSLVREVISPPTDGRASAEYRRAMAGVVITRALREAWEKVGKG